MPEAWCSGLIHDPGDFAGYVKGHNRMEWVKLHATAKNGAGNVAVGKRGFFQFYCPKVGPGMQFAEADAICWDSGNYNDKGPGIEWEREGTGIYVREGLQLFEDMTPDQLASGSLIINWLHTEWGVPLSYFSGPKYGVDNTYRGFVNHGDLDDNRSDGITEAEWVTMIGGYHPSHPPTEEDEVKLRAVFCGDPGFDPTTIFATDGLTKRHLVSGTDWQTLIDLGLMETPVGAAIYIPGETMNGLVEVLP